MGEATGYEGISMQDVDPLTARPVVHLVAGDRYTLLSDGLMLWGCGDNTYHQLSGNATDKNVPAFRPIPLSMCVGERILDVLAAPCHVLVVVGARGPGRDICE
jgi:hypothetical protein